MRLRNLMIVLIACVTLASFTGAAHAAPSTIATSDGQDIATLTDRYESLSKLNSSLTNEEGVVIKTRVGVLASINRALNDSEVNFDGEAVGSVLSAGEGFKWANIMGASHAEISVFLTDDQAGLIQNVGDYHKTGTTLRITGTYHIACSEHQGELDVHANAVEVVDNGGPVTHLVSSGRFRAAVVTCIIAVAILAGFLFARHRLNLETIS